MHRCNVRLPQVPPPPGGYPVVMVVHGGGWFSGDKWTISGFGKSLAAAGIASVNVNYRLAPADKFPAPVDDLRDALIWIAENAGRFDFDTDRIGMWGYSAGAHLSLVTALVANEPWPTRGRTTDWPEDDPRWQALPSVRAVVGGGSPCEFRTLPMDNESMAYWLGGTRREFPGRYAAASPTTLIDPEDPPIRLIHGTADVIVPIRSAAAMQSAAQSAGAKCDLIPLPGNGHITTFTSKVAKQSAVEFFTRHLSVKNE